MVANNCSFHHFFGRDGGERQGYLGGDQLLGKGEDAKGKGAEEELN